MDTNLSGSELITIRALALYLPLTRQSMNIRRIISTDMYEMAQSTMKKSMGNASVILLLCRKAGVEEFIDGHIVHPTRELDAAWIVDHPMRVTHVKVVLETEEHPTELVRLSIPQSQHIPEGVPLVDKDSQAHKDKMSIFCFMQDFCVHTGLPRRYLTHQVDTWVVTQCFRDLFSGDPSASLYVRY